MIREGRYDEAANALNRIIQLKGGKKNLKKAQMKILLEICRQMKKGPAPAPLLGLTAFALFAVDRLGEIGDKRAIPSLKKVKELDQNDPLVSMEAGKVLDKKFK
jgi:hypothetical protein